MSNLVPIIEALDSCRSHAEMARWLLSCPHGYLGKYETIIRVRLRSAGFLAGVEYLETERSLMWLERDHEGGLTDEATALARSARSRMMAIARSAPE